MNGLNRGSEDECRLRANNCVYRLMPLLNLKAEIMNIFRPDDEMSGGWLRMVNGQQEASKSGDWPIRGQERWWGCILVKSKYRCHLLLSGSLACSCQSAASFLLASDWSVIFSPGLWLVSHPLSWPLIGCCSHPCAAVLQTQTNAPCMCCMLQFTRWLRHINKYTQTLMDTAHLFRDEERLWCRICESLGAVDDVSTDTRCSGLTSNGDYTELRLLSHP